MTEAQPVFVLTAPWRTLKAEQILQMLRDGGRIVFYDGSAMRKSDDMAWHLACSACGKRGDAGEFIDAMQRAQQNKQHE